MSDNGQSEALDDDKIGGEYPPDEPLGVEDYGTTPAEERWDEPIDERIEREVPEGDTAAAQSGDSGPLADDDSFTGDETTRDVATEGVPGPAEEEAVHVQDPPAG